MSVSGFPTQPVLLWGQGKGEAFTSAFFSAEPRPYGMCREHPSSHESTARSILFTTGQEKTLLHLLREEAGLTGSKEGCAEGECGACTVFLDGKAVMSCLVPPARAHGADIVTVEGLAQTEPQRACIPCSKLLWTKGQCSVGTARPDC